MADRICKGLKQWVKSISLRNEDKFSMGTTKTSKPNLYIY